MTQIQLATIKALRRPRTSATKPAATAPANDPADIEAVIPPWSVDPGLLKYFRYWSVPIHALMELMSKPKRAPPMVPKVARTIWSIS